MSYPTGDLDACEVHHISHKFYRVFLTLRLAPLPAQAPPGAHTLGMAEPSVAWRERSSARPTTTGLLRRPVCRRAGARRRCIIPNSKCPSAISVLATTHQRETAPPRNEGSGEPGVRKWMATA
jgi:hypothetical protein